MDGENIAQFDLRTSNMLLMLVVVLILLPGASCGVRVGDGSSKSSPGVIGSRSGSNGEKAAGNAPMCGVVGDGVAVEAVETAASLKYASNS